MGSNTQSPKASKPKTGAAKRRSGREVVERLMDAASEEFSTRGYSRTKTATIAQKAGVSENLLFKHFGSKANLFNDTVFVPMERHFAEFSERHVVEAGNAANRTEVSKKYIAEMQGFIREHAEAIMLLIMSSSFEDGEVNGIDKVSGLHRYLESTSDIVRERISGEPRLDPRLIACTSFATILACEIFADWLFPRDWGNEHEINQTVAEFVLGGFRASLGQ